MKKFVFSLALLVLMWGATGAHGGSNTANQFIYKPHMGAGGTGEKALFDAGLDKVDAHLGRYKTLGDPGHETLSAALNAIGANRATLAIPAGAVAVNSNTTIPANVHLMVMQGGELQVATGVTLTINGGLTAGIYKIFSLTGTGAVAFNAALVKEVYPEWWGAAADYNPDTGAGTDSAAAINAALAAHPKVVLLPGKYKISRTLKVRGQCRLLGQGQGTTAIYPATSGGTWINNFAIAYNTSDGVNWDVEWPTKGELSGFQVNGSHNGAFAPVFGLLFAGSINIVDCDFYHLLGAIYKTGHYLDGVALRGVNIWGSRGTSGQYDIHFGMLGDGLVWERVSIASTSTGGVRIDNCWGGTILSCIINTSITLNECRNLTMLAGHMEGGTITQFRGSVTYRDTMFAKSATGPTVSVTGDVYDRAYATFDNCGWHVSSLTNFTADRADIDFSPGATLQLRGCRRQFAVQNNMSKDRKTGILISKGGTMVSDFNKFSAMLSQDCVLHDFGLEPRCWGKRLNINGGSYTPFLFSGGDANITWRAATGSYYYCAAIVVDPTRMIGKVADQETSVSLTNGGAGAGIEMWPSGNWDSLAVTVRIYRGTSSGVYNKYVDVPFIGGVYIWDDGNSVMGFPWQTRSAGPADSLNNMTEVTFLPSRVLAVHSAVPTVGSWAAGDRVQKAAPAAGSNPGWYCVTAGTPGTWKAEANLAP